MSKSRTVFCATCQISFFLSSRRPIIQQGNRYVSQQKPVIHTVDTSNYFQNSLFIRSQATKNVWKYFCTFLLTVNTDFSETIGLDLKSFTSENFRNNAKDACVSLKFRAIESHNAIGLGERYHHTIRRIFNITFTEHPQLSDTFLQLHGIKVINDNMGSNGLAPSIFVFSLLLSFPCPNSNSLNQT